MERMQISKTGTCNKNSELRNSKASNFKSSILNPRMAGFTLIELIIVVFILSLMVGIVTPSFYFLDENRLKKEAGKTASILRYLNDSAISRKETFHLKIDLKNRTLKWGVPDNEKTEKLETLSEVFSTSTGRLAEGELILFFTPSGLKEHLGISLKEKEKEMTINFNPLSGRVKVTKDQES